MSEKLTQILVRIMFTSICNSSIFYHENTKLIFSIWFMQLVCGRIINVDIKGILERSTRCLSSWLVERFLCRAKTYNHGRYCLVIASNSSCSKEQLERFLSSWNKKKKTKTSCWCNIKDRFHRIHLHSSLMKQNKKKSLKIINMNLLIIFKVKRMLILLFLIMIAKGKCLTRISANNDVKEDWFSSCELILILVIFVRWRMKLSWLLILYY